MSCFNLCKCGCGEIVKLNNTYINGHYWTGKKQTNETINKRIKRGKEHYNYKDGHCLIKYYCLDCGKVLHKIGAKYCKEHCTKHRTKEWKIQISRSLRGNIPWNKGLTKETSSSVKKQSDWMTGKNNPMWLNGAKKKPYPKQFSNWLKNRIKQRDEYICYLCNIEHKIALKENLSVHHIDYDKNNCNEKNLITLCKSHNAKVNTNRKYWKQYFENIIDAYLYSFKYTESF